MKREFKYSNYAAIVIGARCAGSTTAMLLARQGARVLLVDRETDIQDTLSTHALMRPAVSLLDEWGLIDEIAGETPAVRNTQFHYGSERIDIPVKSSGAAEGLYAPRRWLLDRVLRESAVDAGAELHTGTSFIDLSKDVSGRVTGAELVKTDETVRHVFSDIVIGADGRLSKVGECVGARNLLTSVERSATVYTYVDGLRNEGYRWYYGNRNAAGLIPTTNGAHCLFTSCSPAELGDRFREDASGGVLKILANGEPEIADELAARGPIERMRRFPGAPGHLRECAGPGWALVGDAGYFKDPATAHGITDAFLDASRLAEALSCTPDDAQSYQRERDHFAPRFFNITQKIASLDWDFERLKSLHLELTACIKAEQLTIPSNQQSLAAAA
ncbi:MAG: NAD(P)/FAD-dependent oxidoreductase [Boseongicola sp.]